MTACMISKVMFFSKMLFLFAFFFTQITLAQKDHPWSARWTSLALRSLPVYYEHQNWRDFKVQHQMALAYYFSNSPKGFQYVQAQLAYRHPLKPVPDPDLFGFQDLETTLVYSFNSSIQVFASGLLPLSKSSVKKPLITAGSVGVSYFLSLIEESEVFSDIGILFKHFISVNAHQNVLKSFLETYIYNDLVSLNHEVHIKGLSYAGFVLESFLGFQNFYTHSSEIYHTWSAEIRLLYSWKNLQLFTSYVRKWNDYDKIMLRTQHIYPYLFLAGVTLSIGMTQ